MIRIEHLRQKSVFCQLEIDHSLAGKGSGILMMDFVGKCNKKKGNVEIETVPIPITHYFLFLFNTSLEWVENLPNIRI